MRVDSFLPVVFMLFIVVLLVKVLSTIKNREPFIANIDKYELSTDDNKYYLYNSQMLIDDKNPIIFNTLDEVRKFEKRHNIKENKVIDLVVEKINDDPQEIYERQCAKKIAPINAEMNTCYSYIKDDKKINELNLLFSSINDVDKDLESCQMKKVVEENPELGKIDNEIKYMSQFF